LGGGGRGDEGRRDARAGGWSGGGFAVLHRREVLHNHAVHENVPAADLAQEEQISGVVEKADITYASVDRKLLK